MNTLCRTALAAAALAVSSSCWAADKVIGITYYIEHPVVVDLLKGFKDSLKAEGIEDGKGYRFETQSAQGSPVTAAQIAKKFAGEPLDLILTLSTPSSQAMVSAVKDKPIVFAGVTDPLGAKLVANMEKPGGNVTGSKDAPPFDKVFELIRTTIPNLKTVGILYNAGEANSKSQVDQIRLLAKAAGVEVFEATVAKPSDVQGAAQSFAGKVQAIFCPNDGTVISNFEVLNRVQLETRIPVFAADVSTVNRGAVAGIGASFYQGGLNAGRIAADILKRGKKAGDIAVVVPDRFDTAVNVKTQQVIGLAIPESIRQGAKLLGQ
jgi:putative ABC transport system substrate-binding protein